MKICSRCKIDKPISEFRRQAKSPDGHAYYCRSCASEKHQEWCNENRDTRNKHHRDSWARHRSKKAAGKRDRYREIVLTDGPEKFRVSNKISYAKKMKSCPGHFAAKQAARRAAISQATPPWADLKAIAAIYAEAAKRGKHVDHVHPLRGKYVCGLHVPWNLQLLDPTENKIKGNRLITV